MSRRKYVNSTSNNARSGTDFPDGLDESVVTRLTVDAADGDWSEPVPELSDLSLLVTALSEAEEARAAGRIVGPVVDEVALHRAARRARRADARRLLRCRVLVAGVAQ
jgi:hypothetical protein